MAATKPVRPNAQLKAAVAAALAWLKKNSVPWRDEADDARFLRGLSLIEQGATDGRNFVKKGVNWALQSIGRRSRKLPPQPCSWPHDWLSRTTRPPVGWGRMRINSSSAPR